MTLLIGIGLGIGVGWWIYRAYKERAAVEAPDLAERMRNIWAIPNAQLKGEAVPVVRRPDDPRGDQDDAEWLSEYGMGV